MTQTERKGWGGFEKVLLGCGVGCIGVALVIGVGMLLAGMWVFTPGRQAATDVIADDASLGVVRLHELADDPGTQELFVQVLERIDEVNRNQRREQLPDGLRWIADLQSRQSDPRGINMMIPKEMTIAFEESADGEDVDFVVAFNPRTMVRMVRGIFGLVSRSDEADIRSDHAGHPVYRLDERSHLAFVDSTVLFSNAAGTLERAIDRLVAGEGVPAYRGDDLTASIPPGEWDVEGIVGNEAGLVDAFLAAHMLERSDDGADSEESPEPLAGKDIHLGFGLDIISAEEIAGTTVLECGDRRTAERLAAVLEERYLEAMADAEARGLELEIESRVEGERVVTELRLVGLGEVIADALTFDVGSAGGEEGRGD